MAALAYLCDDTRADWSARAGRAVNSVGVQEKDQFLTHYDGGTPVGLLNKAHSACLERVRAIQGYHISGNGWADIGYNTLVCPHGRLIEGRGVLTVGAQCPGYNRSGIGSQLMIGGGEVPTVAMLNRQRKFYDDLVKLRRGEAIRKMGHRDGIPTACPGSLAYQWVLNGMPMNVVAPAPTKPTPPPVSTNPPGPRHKFPLPAGYNFARNDGTRYTVSGYFGRVFNGRTDRAWIQEFGSQMTRRGWRVGLGKTYLTTSGNNGYFGPEYERLVRAFQKSRGLKVDGKLGPATWTEAFFEKVT